MDKKPQVKLCTLYVNQAKSGQEYLSGTMGGVRIVGFKSKFSDKGERWNIYVEEREKSEFTKKEPRSEQGSEAELKPIGDKIPF